MPLHAIEITLTRPATPAELHRATRTMALAPNADRTQLMTLSSAKTSHKALQRTRERLQNLLPIDILTTHYPAPPNPERFTEVRPDYDTEWAAMKAVAAKLGIGTTETLRKWVRQDQIDAGTRPGTTSEESAELKRLKKENAELKRANDILKAAASFFAAELDRPHTRS
jgi:transposase